MRKVKVEEAIGMKICHDITKIVPGKYKGPAFRRNHVIKHEDIDKLLDIGKEHVYVWDDDIDEIHEEEAAIRIAEAVKGANMNYDQPKEGKSILRSTKKGLFKVDKQLLRKVNSIQDVTVPCIPNNFEVEEGQKVASARIIPLVIEEEQIKKVENICDVKDKVFEVKPYKKLKVGIVTTGNEVYKGRIKDKFGPIIKRKINYFGGEIIKQVFCGDSTEDIEKAIHSFIQKKADAIILTGGMSVDPDDLTPGAIRNTGAEIITQGAPVQPGNMFMLAYLDNVAIMGVPGAAIFYKTTTLDIVLPRVFAGERFTKTDFIEMAEGGLCLNCNECKYPNCYFGRK